MSRPNVLFVCTDQQRPDWHSPTSLPVETPAIERLGDRGVRFSDAVCPTPVCNPSRACLASGNEYDRCGVPNNEVDYPVGRGTLYRRLRDEAGYHVAGCGKFDLTTDYRLGKDGVPESPWGFSDATFTPAKNETVSRAAAANGEPRDPYTSFLAEEGLLEAHIADYDQRSGEDKLRGGKLVSTFPTSLPDYAYYDEWITRQGTQLIEGAPTEKPWFLQVNLQNPHDPWDVTENMFDEFRDPDVEFPLPPSIDEDVPLETHQEVRRNYAAMIEHVDSCLGTLVEAVKARGDYDDTVVVFCSDHGEMLGDHGQWQKDSPLRPSVGVPFVVGGPGVVSRDPVDDPVTILDLHATVLEYAGLDAGDVDSRSMRGFLEGRDRLPRDVVYAGLSTWRMVYDGTYKLIRGYDPDRRVGTAYEPRGVEPAEVTRLLSQRRPVLYDTDRDEAENVAAEHPNVVERLSSRLHEIRGRLDGTEGQWRQPT